MIASFKKKSKKANCDDVSFQIKELQLFISSLVSSFCKQERLFGDFSQIINDLSSKVEPYSPQTTKGLTRINGESIFAFKKETSSIVNSLKQFNEKLDIAMKRIVEKDGYVKELDKVTKEATRLREKGLDLTKSEELDRRASELTDRVELLNSALTTTYDFYVSDEEQGLPEILNRILPLYGKYFSKTELLALIESDCSPSDEMNRVQATASNSITNANANANTYTSANETNNPNINSNSNHIIIVPSYKKPPPEIPSFSSSCSTSSTSSSSSSQISNYRSVSSPKCIANEIDEVNSQSLSKKQKESQCTLHSPRNETLSSLESEKSPKSIIVSSKSFETDPPKRPPPEVTKMSSNSSQNGIEPEPPRRPPPDVNRVLVNESQKPQEFSRPKNPPPKSKKVVTKPLLPPKSCSPVSPFVENPFFPLESEFATTKPPIPPKPATLSKSKPKSTEMHDNANE